METLSDLWLEARTRLGSRHGTLKRIETAEIVEWFNNLQVQVALAAPLKMCGRLRLSFDGYLSYTSSTFPNCAIASLPDSCLRLSLTGLEKDSKNVIWVVIDSKLTPCQLKDPEEDMSWVTRGNKFYSPTKEEPWVFLRGRKIEIAPLSTGSHRTSIDMIRKPTVATDLTASIEIDEVLRPILPAWMASRALSSKLGLIADGMALMMEFKAEWEQTTGVSWITIEQNRELTSGN